MDLLHDSHKLQSNQKAVKWVSDMMMLKKNNMLIRGSILQLMDKAL